MAMDGKLIALEGGEGGGKTSLLKELKERLPKDKFVFTREPGGTPFAEEMRKVIFANNDDPFKELCLFFAARRDHILKLIRPALARGLNVISDRYVPSTYAYQIVAPKHFYLEDCFGTMVRFAESSLDPSDDNFLRTHYLWLDGDVEVFLSRKKNQGEMNSFDQRPIEFHRGVREGFSRFFERDRSRAIHSVAPDWTKINAEDSPEIVLQRALQKINEITGYPL